jgi:hypothetical protein
MPPPDFPRDKLLEIERHLFANAPLWRLIW